MNFSDPVKRLSQTSMTRKQFITRIGAAAVAVTALPHVLKALGNHTESQKSNGFGSGAYGGKPKNGRN